MEAFPVSNSVLDSLALICLGSPYQLYIKRDDLIHPVVSGNKWRKLKYHIQNANELGKKHLVTFGGAFSNHLVAVACAGAALKFKTSAFLRGDELNSESNHYLKLAKCYGMELIPVSREQYAASKIKLFEAQFENNEEAYFIDEGGAGADGERGVAEIIFELPFVPDHIIHASATGTTAAGLLKGLNRRQGFQATRLHSVAVLKNGNQQRDYLAGIDTKINWQVHEGDQGGYAKSSPELEEFIQNFVSETGILIDFVYTAKALFKLKNLIREGIIGQQDTTVFLHTGGVLTNFKN